MPKIMKISVILLTIFVVGAMSIQSAYAGNMFVIALGSEDPPGGSGWFAGYVVYGQSGTYTLRISASGSSFPITNVKVIVLISDAAQAGGLESLSIEGTPITTYTPGEPGYYGASGGPFAEPDYYGFNDQYVIPQLTASEAKWPDNAKDVSVTVTFAAGAGSDSKVMFLCYGTNANGHSMKTAFSEGTMFVVPEYTAPIVGIGACFAAFVAFKKMKH